LKDVNQLWTLFAGNKASESWNFQT